jgi:glycosyltransferase involved in cell wall biosynthesis
VESTTVSSDRTDNAVAADTQPPVCARVSVVIPALNEATRLPLLFDRLERQTCPPTEIVVADAHSTDDTRAIALCHGARVVDGGMPGPGRNAGAAVAVGDIIVFMDADAEPDPRLLEKAIAEFERRGLDAATAPMRPSTGETIEVNFWCAVAELYIRALQRLAPHAVGLFIVVRRELHERIGGFDESVVLAEDHEYVRRASKAGKYRVLHGVKVRTSMRRIHHEGRLKILQIFWYSEIRTLLGIPIRSIPFEYDFGGFVPDTQLYTLSAALRRFWRIVAKPSTEVQTDALFAALISLVVGVGGTAAFAVSGLGAVVAVPFALVAAAALSLSVWIAVRKLRFERHYGPFFMGSVAVSDVTVTDNDGRVIIRRGVDEVAEVHEIGSLDRMAELNRQGAVGLLTIAKETLEGVRAMVDDLDDPAYAEIRYVIGYSNLTATLFKMGFDEIDDPPKLDPINRFYKPIMTKRLSKKMGKELNGDVEDYRMAYATKEFMKTGFRDAVDAQLLRVQRGLERAERLGRTVEGEPAAAADRSDAPERAPAAAD